MSQSLHLFWEICVSGYRLPIIYFISTNNNVVFINSNRLSFFPNLSLHYTRFHLEIKFLFQRIPFKADTWVALVNQNQISDVKSSPMLLMHS